jgi:hypothetical protein
MSQTTQALIGLAALVALLILSQWIAGRRIRGACRTIVADLERAGAFDPVGAAELPYAKGPLIRIGLRDFRPRALQGLVSAGIVGRTARGAYFIRNRDQARRLTGGAA